MSLYLEADCISIYMEIHTESEDLSICIFTTKDGMDYHTFLIKDFIQENVGEYVKLSEIETLKNALPTIKDLNNLREHLKDINTKYEHFLREPCYMNSQAERELNNMTKFLNSILAVFDRYEINRAKMTICILDDNGFQCNQDLGLKTCSI